VHHAHKGQANAPVQRVFVRPRLRSRFEASSARGAAREAPRPNAGVAVTLEASGNCENCDWTNAVLDGQDFSDAILNGTIFAGAGLVKTNFTNAKMQGCYLTVTPPEPLLPYEYSPIVNATKFIGADLTGAHFDGILGNADFTGAILDETTWGPQLTTFYGPETVFPAVMNGNFSNASLKSTTFNGALLDGSIFDSATIVADFHVSQLALAFPPAPISTNVSGGHLQTSCQSCRFQGTTISESNFNGVNLAGAVLTNAVITRTTFNGADLTRAILNEAHLNGVDLFGTKLTGVDLTVIASGSVIHSDFSGDLTGANLSDIDFTGFDLSRADLSHAILSGEGLASLRGAKLSDGVAHGITLAGAVFPDDFGGFQGKDLRFANLTGATLKGADLRSANLANAFLRDTQLAEGQLQHATLTEAVLQGAILNFANLDGADLRGAHLNRSPTKGGAASLEGAFLRNANLASADLSGATLANANFYSSICCECPGETWSAASPTCASATAATMTGTVFTGAYLSGVDMSGSIPQAAHFDHGAVLVGVKFNGALLSQDPNGNHTLFTGAFLQGADFTDATVTGADFTSAYVDLASAAGATMAFLLDGTHTQFTGYWATPATPACVEVTYNGPTALPPTDGSNICPDGVTRGPCSDATWESPQFPISNAQPPSSVCQSGSCECTVPNDGSVEADLTWIID
jgi:uncharacterized protein YjbI with pentapeptide repeats